MVYDVVVLGAGISGVAAALAAADGGARVCVITGPPGSSALFSGAWRGPLPTSLRAHLGRAGYELRECHDPLPHPHGPVVSVPWAAASHHAAQLQGNVLVCGVAGLSGFEAPVLARLWSSSAGSVRAAQLLLDATPRSGWANASLAASLERDSSDCMRALTQVVQKEKPDCIVLPAILGIDQTESIRASLEQAAGVRIGEALGVAPSLPGWRLHTALRRALHSADVQLMHGQARVGRAAELRVQSITVDGSSIEALSYVLATGKFVAGGVHADGVLREPVFDCPIWLEHLDNVFTTAEPLMLTDPERTEAQPLLRAGVHCDQEQRPVNHGGDVVFGNVFIAGSVRADWESATHGAGDCASDGWRAGERAVQA